ncbi:MAG: metal-binding protein, partial [Gammaproteobacteria bacterium]|nr:metal-binding protein [Gammaproteobacteria bacterium]
MFKNVVIYFLLTIFSVLPVHAESRDKVLVLGKVSNDPKRHYPGMKKMADYVVANMQDLGIKKGKVL